MTSLTRATTWQSLRRVLLGAMLALPACETPFEASHTLQRLGDIVVPAVLARGATDVVSFRSLTSCFPAPPPTVIRTTGALTIALWERDRSPAWAVSEGAVDPFTSPCFEAPQQSVPLTALPGEQLIRVRIRQPEGEDYIRIVRISPRAL